MGLEVKELEEACILCGSKACDRLRPERMHLMALMAYEVDLACDLHNTFTYCNRRSHRLLGATPALSTLTKHTTSILTSSRKRFSPSKNDNTIYPLPNLKPETLNLKLIPKALSPSTSSTLPITTNQQNSSRTWSLSSKMPLNHSAPNIKIKGMFFGSNGCTSFSRCP